MNSTKKYYELFKASQMNTIHHAYARPSIEKTIIWGRIVKDAIKDYAYRLKIITANKYVFTAGYTFERDDGIYFKLYTPSKTITVKLN